MCFNILNILQNSENSVEQKNIKRVGNKNIAKSITHILEAWRILTITIFENPLTYNYDYIIAHLRLQLHYGLSQ